MKIRVFSIFLIFLTGTVMSVPSQAQPVSLAQAPQLSTTVTFCRDAESWSPGKDMESSIALAHDNAFSPISTEFLRQIGAHHDDRIENLKHYRTTLVESPKHGTVEIEYLPSHHWTYKPLVDYEGTDRVIYLVESQGKHYKVVINFLVAHIFDEKRKVQECDAIDFGASNLNAKDLTQRSSSLPPVAGTRLRRAP